MHPFSLSIEKLRQTLQRFELNMLWRLPTWATQLGDRRSPMGPPMLLVAIALWIIRRHYDGIRHDGMFYAGQTMVRLGDPNIAQDLFFRYGSQDQYTIYSSVMAFAVRAFGWVEASMGSVVISQIGFVAGVVLLLLEFAPMTLVALGLGFCAICPFYGPFNIFSLGEPFTTSRSLAEPLLLFAIYALFKGRELACLLLLALASVMHPLLSAPVWFVLFALTWAEQPQRRKLLGGALALGLLIFCVAAYLQPAFFFSTYDDAWWNAFVNHTSQVYLQGWDYRGWALIAFDLLVPLLLARQLTGRNAMFLRLVSLALALGLLITAWGAEFMRSVFLTEIQIWRAEELAHVMAAGLFPFLVWKLRGNGVTVLLGTFFILLGFDYLGYDSAAVGVVLGVALLWLGNRVPNPTNSMKILVLVFATTAICIGFYNQMDLFSYGIGHEYRFTLGLATYGALASWMGGAAFILGAAMLAKKAPRGAIAVGLGLVVCCAFLWDNRTPFQKYLENQLGQPSPLADLIPPGASVYWGDDLRQTWFILDRPSFYSRNQSAGLLFKRQTAMAFTEHEEQAAPIKYSVEVCESIEHFGSKCSFNVEAIHEICKPGGADFLILNRPVESIAPNRNWKIHLKGDATLSYGVYDCHKLKEDPLAVGRTRGSPGQAKILGLPGDKNISLSSMTLSNESSGSKVHGIQLGSGAVGAGPGSNILSSASASKKAHST